MTDQNALQSQIAKGTDKEEGEESGHLHSQATTSPRGEPQDLMPECLSGETPLTSPMVSTNVYPHPCACLPLHLSGHGV